MKKLILPLLFVLSASVSNAQTNLLEGKQISTLGPAKTWSKNVEIDGQPTIENYTFKVEDLSKLIKTPQNTDNVYLFPEPGWNTEDNRAIGIQGFYVDMGSVQNVGSVITTWEGAAADEYKIYLTDATPTLDILETEATYSAKGLGQYKENTAVLPDGSKGQYLVFQPIKATDYGWGVKIRSIVAQAPDRGIALSIRIADVEMKINETNEVRVLPLNSIGEVLEGEGLLTDIAISCSNPDAVDIYSGNSPEVFNIKGLKAGTYTITVSAKNSDGDQLTASATLRVLVDWNGLTNIAQGKAISARWKGEETADNHSYQYATDDDLDSYYCYNGDWGGGDSWVIIDLGADHAISTISTFFGVGNTGGLYRVAYASDVEETAIPGEGDDIDKSWTGLGLNGWTTISGLKRIANAQNDYIFDNSVIARYIAVADENNPGGKPQYCEIRVAGQLYSDAELSSIKLSVSQPNPLVGETTAIEYKLLDQFDAEFNSEDVPVFTITSNNANLDGSNITFIEKGEVTVEATLGNVTAELTINVVADQNDYVMDGANVSSDTNKTEGKYATDGGSNPTEIGGTYVVEDNTESQGDHKHWILAELDNAYNLDMIIAIWEGAYPGKYTVSVGPSEENLSVVYTVDNLSSDNLTSRLSGQPMDNVRFIKIETFNNATGWGVKLQDLKAYGTAVDMEDVLYLHYTDANGNYVSTHDEKLLKSNAGSYGLRVDFPSTLGENVYFVFSDKTPEKAEELSIMLLAESSWNGFGNIYHNTGDNALGKYENGEDAPSPFRLASGSVYSISVAPEDNTATFSVNGTSGVESVAEDAECVAVDVYSLQGVAVRRGVEASNATDGLPAGIYIVGGKKVYVK